MLTDLNTSVVTISPEQLDKLFEEVPDATVTPDALNMGKGDTPIKLGANSDMDIPVMDLDNIKEPTEEDETDKDDKGKTDDKIVDKDKKDKKEDKSTDTKGKDDKKLDVSLDDASKEVLKNTINFLVEKGIFKDFEGRDTLEVTEEVYSELVEKQLDEIINERYEAKKKSAGEYGEAILDYLEKGGDADQIIDLFKERKAIQDFDTTDDESKKELVVKWYKEMHNWKPDKIKGYVDMLLSKEGGLEAEADEIKTQYEEYYKQQLSDLRKQQDLYEEDQKRKKVAFETNLTKAIDSNETFDDKSKSLIKSSLFKFNKKLPDGTPVNDLYLKFAQIQADPAQYVEFAEWVLDRDAYIRRKSLESQNKDTDKKFSFIKKNAAVSKTKGSTHVVPEDKDDEKYTGTNFSLLFKK